MSVIRFGDLAISRLGATIAQTDGLRDVFFNREERLENKFLYRDVIEDEYHYLTDSIYAFVDRAWIANQCACIYQYEDSDRTISRLQYVEAPPYSLSDFIEQASSLRYNLYTNNGRVFLGQADLDRLDRLIDAAKDLLLDRLTHAAEARA
jgi:hypothetical protein